ncbi:lipase/esterase family protein [Aspergillus taichungensis]|uniref:Lipase/esterase family protein n=1 Tax=Aspergillus taichungensis TaxID=482145 RepID=A0A2J5HDV7_9EURO|nr:lipase/esterase family protein [Aspergillus taichungensis]
MPLNMVALSVALTPTVVSTFFSHYVHRKSHHHTPSVHISYDEGIQIIREFLVYSSKHTIEDLQRFCSQRVPSPYWVKTERLSIPDKFLSLAANTIINELGPRGIARVGGKEWWQWRGPSEDLTSEWVEMRNDYNGRTEGNGRHPSEKRIMLYIHGGAYFFGSPDSHRYQIQRHARKLQGRIFTPQYRLAPQFPFPCALQDCLAAYLYLLDSYKAEEILFAGDSAGGGLALSLLVIIRDQGLPLPAGAILLSPWGDLTHSFPSIVKENPGDYIPRYGFRHKPSVAWPPPNSDEILAIRKGVSKLPITGEGKVPGESDATDRQYSEPPNVDKGTFDEPENIKVPMDGKVYEIKDQVHTYAPNELLGHPLVSPVLQASLGGLPPLQILVGGGEKLRDEQIYLAHKAADPAAYPPSDACLNEHDPNRETLHKYPGTYVQLQVWDDLCHVATTLSFTRPAKYMFRSIAQFGAWALACAQESEIDILDDNEVSPVSSTNSVDQQTPSRHGSGVKRTNTLPVSSIGKAGDPLPAFKDHMIRQRVDKRGNVYPLDPPSSFEALQMPKSQIGTFNPELVKHWLAEKLDWDKKYAKEKRQAQEQQAKEMASSLGGFNGERPPACSLAARKEAPGVLPTFNPRKSYPMMLWSNWASKHDERTIERGNQKDGRPRRTSVDAGRAGASIKGSRPTSSATNAEKAAQSNTQPQDIPQRLNGEASSSHNRAPSDEKPPPSPMIVLPAYEDDKKFSEENSSTRALFHAPGVLPTKHRPTSYGGSATIRSGITATDVADDTSTIDDPSLAVTGTGVDAASTRAVLHAKGVVGVLGDGDSAHHSVDAFSMPRNSADLDTLSTSAAQTATDGLTPPARPDMPEREVFKTANEYVTH